MKNFVCILGGYDNFNPGQFSVPPPNFNPGGGGPGGYGGGSQGRTQGQGYGGNAGGPPGNGNYGGSQGGMSLNNLVKKGNLILKTPQVE